MAAEADREGLSPDPGANIDRALSELRESFAARFRAAATEQVLRDEKAKVLGKKGDLTAILSQLGKAPPDQRKRIGEGVNALKQEVESLFEECLRDLRKKERAAELEAPPFDLTLPARLPLADGGHRHPISRVFRVDRGRMAGETVLWNRRAPGSAHMCSAITAVRVETQLKWLT